jgi:ubiquinone/menaquinone biosynthesis C-methylase UbiE
MSEKRAFPSPMSYKKADHLLNPLRKLILSPASHARRLSLDSRASVLELGCGPGYYSAEVARSIPLGRLTLVDIQPEMLEMAKTRLDSFGISNIDYVKADAAALPFENDSFDVVYMIAVLGEIPEIEKCIGELSRVLRKGGLLSVSEQSRDPHFIPINEMKDLVGDSFHFEKFFGHSRSYTANFRKAG